MFVNMIWKIMAMLALTKVASVVGIPGEEIANWLAGGIALAVISFMEFFDETTKEVNDPD